MSDVSQAVQLLDSLPLLLPECMQQGTRICPTYMGEKVIWVHYAYTTLKEYDSEESRTNKDSLFMLEGQMLEVASIHYWRKLMSS